MHKVDLIVIGAGPGGYVAALRGAQQGLKTVLVEENPQLGGTCLLRGCIPTKALIQSARTYELCRKGAKTFGIKVPEAEVDWPAVLKRKAMVVKKGSMGVSMLMKKHGVEVVRGRGVLDGPQRVRVEGAPDGRDELIAPKIVLATGSSVARLPGLEPDGGRIITSDHLLEIGEIPESMIILGAGAVGVEFADIFSVFGARVTLVEMLPRILPLEDPDCGEVLAKCLARAKVDIRTGTRAGAVEATPEKVMVDLQGPDLNAERIEADRLLVAIGRSPNTKDIGLDTVDAVVDSRGFIQTDAMMETAEGGLFAIGDIVSTPQLAHVATAEALVAVAHIAGRKPRPLNYDQVPSCTYCTPEVASVGLGEPTAIARGYEIETAQFPFSALGKASILNELHGFVKVVRDVATGRVLGVHMVGPHATDLIAEACVALAADLDIERWSAVMHPHPTLSEAMLEALHTVLGEAVHG